MTKALLAPVISRKSLKNTYHYAGGTVSILLSAADTGGEFSVWEAVQKPGGEPPLHLHHTTDETFFLLEGKMRFMVGDTIIDASAGNIVFAPRGVPHSFRIKSPQARAITICTPAGFEEWFRELGTPAANFDLPERVLPPTQDEIRKMIVLSQKLKTDLLRDVDF
jgi:mannose-6-phosphate isomerase-like protein (cupin superfamily)